MPPPRPGFADDERLREKRPQEEQLPRELLGLKIPVQLRDLFVVTPVPHISAPRIALRRVRSARPRARWVRRHNEPLAVLPVQVLSTVKPERARPILHGNTPRPERPPHRGMASLVTLKLHVPLLYERQPEHRRPRRQERLLRCRRILLVECIEVSRTIPRDLPPPPRPPPPPSPVPSSTPTVPGTLGTAFATATNCPCALDSPRSIGQNPTSERCTKCLSLPRAQPPRPFATFTSNPESCGGL